MSMNPSIIIRELGLTPLPVEGGLFAQTWIDNNSSAIYYLVLLEDSSGLHKLPTPEVFFFHGGAPAQMLLLFPDGSTQEPILGMDLENGQRPQVVVPSGVWQATETLGEWSLLATYMAPPYNEIEVKFGSADHLAPLYPQVAARISHLDRRESK